MSYSENVAPPSQIQQTSRSGVGYVIRLLVAWTSLALAALLTAPAVVARWAHETMGSEQAYVSAVASVGSDPVLQQAAAEQVSAAVVQRLGLGETFDAAVKGVVSQLVIRAMETEAFEAAWNAGNAAAQREIVGALSGGESAVTVQGEDVMLDLSVLLNAIKDGLVEQGLGIAANVEVPAGQVQIRIMDATTLSQAQSLYRISEPFGGWAIYLVAGLYLLALLIAPKRGPILLMSGLAMAGSGLLVLGFLALGESAFRAQLVGQPFEPVAATYFRALAAPLSQVPSVMVIGGLVAVVIGILWWIIAARRTR